MALQAERAPLRAIRLPSLSRIGSVASAQVGTLLFLLVIAIFFFASGASGLIYQVAWVRILSLIFGVTVQAVSAVLAGFMLGLAVGSYLAGRFSDRIKNPLIAYAFIEFGIGATGLLTPWAFGVLRDAYPAIYRWSEGVSATLGTFGALALPAAALPDLIRLLLAFGILLIPTTLMGATLPVILRSTVLNGGSLGCSVSLLYAINTAGAIFGAVAAGFVLIANSGVQGSIQTAAVINIAIGFASLLLAAVVNMLTSTRSAGISQSAVFVAFGLSGFFALGYEVIWFRLLGIFFENVTYSFTIMLAAVLFGIAVGSYVLGPVLGTLGRFINWWIVFALLQFAIGLCALGSVRVLGNLEAAIQTLQGWEWLQFLTQYEDYRSILAAVAAIAPAMFFSGMTFAVAATLYVGDREDAGHRVGTLYAANLVGSILGSAVAGFLLIPVLSSQRSLFLLATGSLLAGALVLWLAPRTSTHWAWKAGLTVAGGLVFWSAVQTTPDLYENVLATKFPNQEVVWYREGVESSVTVVRNPADNYITLYTNSRGQARDEPALVEFHRLLGHMPMLVHPDPKRALIVGIGGGATAGAIAQYPGVQVDAAELSDAVIEAVRFFAHVNYAFFTLPNVTIRQADARNYLLLTDQRYDVVSGDAIRPNDAGSATLYSVEYYRLVASRLTENGVMTQWIPPFSDYQYKMILRTFLTAFPHATLWQSGDLIIGSNSPIVIDRARLQARFADPKTAAALREAGITNPNDFLSRFNATADEVRARIGPGPIITDDRPYIEYFRSLPQDGPPDVTGYSRNIQPILR
ncbi:MAG: spermidine synthase [Dehalococcoidia bacterium]|nr:MAG: spermidine synthase [Dehalococcoidia bacterium]